MPASPEMTLPELSQFATELEDPMLVDNVFPEQPPFDFLHIIVQKHKVERIQFQNNLSKSIPFCVSPFSHLFLPPPFFFQLRARIPYQRCITNSTLIALFRWVTSICFMSEIEGSSWICCRSTGPLQVASLCLQNFYRTTLRCSNHLRPWSGSMAGPRL